MDGLDRGTYNKGYRIWSMGKITYDSRLRWQVRGMRCMSGGRFGERGRGLHTWMRGIHNFKKETGGRRLLVGWTGAQEMSISIVARALSVVVIIT